MFKDGLDVGEKGHDAAVAAAVVAVARQVMQVWIERGRWDEEKVREGLGRGQRLQLR
jgi:hypothetical protein